MEKQPSADVGRLVLLGFIALAVLTLGFGVWSTMARITGAVITPGTIEVDRNRQVVQHRDGGVIADILVDDGSVVRADDLLLRLDTTTPRAELAFARVQLFDLKAQRDRLRAESSNALGIVFLRELIRQSDDDAGLTELLYGQRRLFEANIATMRSQTSQLRQRQRQIRAQITGFTAQIAALVTQRELVAAALIKQEALLKKGWSQAAAVLQLRREESALEGRQGELQASLAQAKERITEAEIEIVQRADEQKSQAIAAMSAMEEPIRRLHHQTRQLEAEIAAADIRAPTSGIVYQMSVQTQRAVIRPAEPLMYLIPQDRPQVIAAQVQPQHIDQVHIGQAVKMRLSALNARTTPEVFGHITQVSADAIRDEVRGSYYFRVEVVLDVGELAKLPEGAVLLPGMPVEMFIQTGDRSPMAYLIKPISDYLARALRES